MYQFQNPNDTIAAISTPAGQGGIGIVRISGPEALKIADKIFCAKNKHKPSQAKTFTVHYGNIVDEDEPIDEVLLTVMLAPKSYTTEDVVEISCHGGMISLKAILTLICKSGARLAEPGEFTKRAFLNGRIDLPQAEAVLDIIQSKTEAFLKVSTHQLKGDLSVELENIREQLMQSYTEIEAFVNFPEDEIDTKGRTRISEDIQSAKQKVANLLASSDHGRVLKEGIKIVICGKPNVGKSSLLNVLLKTPRAIVSNIAGTTRDTIEETAQIKGIPFQCIDTAGILTPRDEIEQEAIKRSHMYIDGADLILLMLDSSQALEEEDQKLIEKIKEKNTLIILNKTDLVGKVHEPSLLPNKKQIKISALKKMGIASLETAIVENIWHEKNIDTHGVMVSNLRHIQALRDAQNTLQKACNSLNEGLSLEFVSEEIKIATNHLDAITGRNIDADLLDTIFSKFCIGK